MSPTFDAVKYANIAIFCKLPIDAHIPNITFCLGAGKWFREGLATQLRMSEQPEEYGPARESAFISPRSQGCIQMFWGCRTWFHSFRVASPSDSVCSL